MKKTKQFVEAYKAGLGYATDALGLMVEFCYTGIKAHRNHEHGPLRLKYTISSKGFNMIDELHDKDNIVYLKNLGWNLGTATGIVIDSVSLGASIVATAIYDIYCLGKRHFSQKGKKGSSTDNQSQLETKAKGPAIRNKMNLENIATA
jgi:hypothetical protein